jgi:ribonuclease P protein component
MAPQGAHNPSPGAGKKNPRSGRLLRHADFEQVYKQGRRHFSTHMTVFYLRRAEGEGLRVGFTVGRALGGAVQRNRMKRRLREAVRLSRPAPGPAADVVINPKKSVRTLAFSDLLAEVNRAFEVIAQKLAEKPRTPSETSGPERT